MPQIVATIIYSNSLCYIFRVDICLIMATAAMRRCYWATWLQVPGLPTLGPHLQAWSRDTMGFPSMLPDTRLGFCLQVWSGEDYLPPLADVGCGSVK